MGYESLPEHMIDKTVIEEAQAGGTSHASFLREYCATFTDGCDSYFSARKMHESTIPDGEEPSTLIKGKKDKEYVLGLDPNMSDSPSADFFGMALIEVDKETGTGTLVHNYAGLGSLNKHVCYLYYILSNFEVSLIIADNAGSDMFFDSCNNSEIFKKNKIDLKNIDFHSDYEGAEYTKEIRNLKRKEF